MLACVSPREAALARKFHSRAEVVTTLNLFVPATAGQDSVTSLPSADAAPAVIRIATVGRVAPQKDPEMFAEIVAALRVDGRVEATWVGDGPEPLRGALETADVAITGWLPVRAVPAALSGHTVYLHTAQWEGAVPMTVYEAMDAGLPVVIRRHPSYDSLLPPEWQFDDVSTAVRMVRLLAEEPARERRVIEQIESARPDLRGIEPGAVLPPAYRRLMTRSRTTPVASAEHDRPRTWWIRPRKRTPGGHPLFSIVTITFENVDGLARQSSP